MSRFPASRFNQLLLLAQQAWAELGAAGGRRTCQCRFPAANAVVLPQEGLAPSGVQGLQPGSGNSGRGAVAYCREAAGFLLTRAEELSRGVVTATTSRSG